jgi:hypothetical protein
MLRKLLFAITLLIGAAFLLRNSHAEPPQTSQMVFSIGVSAKLNLMSAITAPRCNPEDLECKEFTRLCDSEGSCVKLNVGAFSIHAVKEENGGATDDRPVGTLTLTLGQP